MIIARPHRHIVVTMRNHFKAVMGLIQFLQLLFLALIFQDFSTNWELQDDMVGTQAQFLQMREVSVENYMILGYLFCCTHNIKRNTNGQWYFKEIL